VQNETIAVSWIIGESVFSGISSVNGSFANLRLTEVALTSPVHYVDVTGGGTGAKTQVTGGGTGAKTQVTGGGTGAKTQVTGGGTGAKTEVTGGGTGVKTQVTGGGTGVQAEVTGGGTGASILVTGGGTGAEAIAVTLPNGTGISMEVTLGCGTAEVSIVDEYSVPLATFKNVPIIGNTGLCSESDSGGIFNEYYKNPRGIYID
jgi:hypothetical protein